MDQFGVRVQGPVAAVRALDRSSGMRLGNVASTTESPHGPSCRWFTSHPFETLKHLCRRIRGIGSLAGFGDSFFDKHTHTHTHTYLDTHNHSSQPRIHATHIPLHQHTLGTRTREQAWFGSGFCHTPSACMERHWKIGPQEQAGQTLGTQAGKRNGWEDTNTLRMRWITSFFVLFFSFYHYWFLLLVFQFWVVVGHVNHFAQCLRRSLEKRRYPLV